MNTRIIYLELIVAHAPTSQMVTKLQFTGLGRRVKCHYCAAAQIGGMGAAEPADAAAQGVQALSVSEGAATEQLQEEEEQQPEDSSCPEAAPAGAQNGAALNGAAGHGSSGAAAEPGAGRAPPAAEDHDRIIEVGAPRLNKCSRIMCCSLIPKNCGGYPQTGDLQHVSETRTSLCQGHVSSVQLTILVNKPFGAQECLFGGLHSVEDSELPILTSDFYSKHMLPAKPEGVRRPFTTSFHACLPPLATQFTNEGAVRASARLCRRDSCSADAHLPGTPEQACC